LAEVVGKSYQSGLAITGAARSVILNFVGFAFGPGMATEEYESQNNVLAAEDSQIH
jgi:hypothetical protein